VQAEATGASRGLAEWTFATEAGDGAFVVEVGGGGLIAFVVEVGGGGSCWRRITIVCRSSMSLNLSLLMCCLLALAHWATSCLLVMASCS
jgi:hypothetical protein